MNIHFNLVYPSREESPIRVSVTNGGKQYRKSIGITTPTKFWKKEKTGNPKKDAAIRIIRTGLEECLDGFPDENAILRALDRIEDGKWKDLPSTTIKTSKRPSFWAYFKEWSERDNPAKRQRVLSYNLIGELMGMSDDWEGVDSAYARSPDRQTKQTPST